MPLIRAVIKQTVTLSYINILFNALVLHIVSQGVTHTK